MYTLRNINESDHAIMRSLAKKCPPLDLHTQYTYWVNAAYFPDCSFILESDGEPVGYIMTVENSRILFIWQIGILPEHRGKGLSGQLISACLDYAASCGKKIQVTIAEDNIASYRSFLSACEKKGYKPEKVDTVRVTDNDDPGFEECEIRYEITPYYIQ